jgi:hypothetical protein
MALRPRLSAGLPLSERSDSILPVVDQAASAVWLIYRLSKIAYQLMG